MTELFAPAFMLNPLINFFLLGTSSIVLIWICLWLIISKSLIESVIIMSAFSLFISICYLFMDAPDVAMTEVSLGACLSTCVLLNLIKIFGNKKEKPPSKTKLISAGILCLILIGFLVFAGLDLPLYGKEDSPLQTHLTKYYIENTRTEIGIPSIVAAILASYRGYDTLGETTVILIAGIAVVLILARRKE